MPQLLEDLKEAQILQIYLEMIQMKNKEDTQVDHRASIIQQSNEQKLISKVETQKTIIDQRVTFKQQPKKGFFAFLKCCVCKTPATTRPQN